MTSRDDIIAELLIRDHVDVTKRKIVGAAIRISEITRIVEPLLSIGGSFPAGVQVWEKQGDKCYEGGILRRVGSIIELHRQVASPLDPRVRIRHSVSRYEDPVAAIAAMTRLRWGTHIDGIAIDYRG
jgi:hypothetical protein